MQIKGMSGLISRTLVHGDMQITPISMQIMVTLVQRRLLYANEGIIMQIRETDGTGVSASYANEHHGYANHCLIYANEGEEQRGLPGQGHGHANQHPEYANEPQIVLETRASRLVCKSARDMQMGCKSAPNEELNPAGNNKNFMQMNIEICK